MIVWGEKPLVKDYNFNLKMTLFACFKLSQKLAKLSKLSMRSASRYRIESDHNGFRLRELMGWAK